MIVWLWLLFTSLVLSRQSCKRQLEKTLFRPKTCGIRYFKALARDLNAKVAHTSFISEGKIPELCAQFRNEYKVGLNIINPGGIDMCTLKNPTASAYVLLMESLLYRSPADRHAIYLNYQFAPINIPLPPPDRPNFDAVGVYYMYRDILRYFLAERPATAVPYIFSMIDYINSNYDTTGLQQSVTLQNFHLFTTISDSVPSSECIPYFVNVLVAYFEEPFPVGITNESYFTVQALFNFAYYTFADDNRIILPLSVRQTNYIRLQNYMLLYQGAAGITRSFSQFVPVNVYANGLCSYAYNWKLPYGQAARIIFSQTELLG